MMVLFHSSEVESIILQISARYWKIQQWDFFSFPCFQEFFWLLTNSTPPRPTAGQEISFQMQMRPTICAVNIRLLVSSSDLYPSPSHHLVCFPEITDTGEVHCTPAALNANFVSEQRPLLFNNRGGNSEKTWFITEIPIAPPSLNYKTALWKDKCQWQMVKLLYFTSTHYVSILILWILQIITLTL